MSTDPADADELDLTWSDWHSLNPTEGELSTIPTTAGLYHIRRRHRSGLEYIGQTGRSLRRRIGALARNADKETMSYRDLHTAAPCSVSGRFAKKRFCLLGCIQLSLNASVNSKRKRFEAIERDWSQFMIGTVEPWSVHPYWKAVANHAG